MIYTLRTFHVDSGNYDAFARLGEEKVWPALESQGARAVGLWVRVVAGSERLLQMMRYESLAHWQTTRDWQSDDGAAKEAQAERAGLVHDTGMIALSPLTRTQPEGSAPESDPGIYTMRRFSVARQDVPRLVELSEDGWWPWVTEGQGFRPVGQWLSIVAPETLVYMICRYNDLAHWEATRGAGPEPEDPKLYAIWNRGRIKLRERSAMTRETDVCVLRPIGSRRP